MDEVEIPDLTIKVSHQLLDDMIRRVLRLSSIEYPIGAKADLLYLETFLKRMKEEANHGA